MRADLMAALPTHQGRAGRKVKPRRNSASRNLVYRTDESACGFQRRHAVVLASRVD